MRSLDLGYVERRVHVKAGVELTFERVCISGARCGAPLFGGGG